MASEIIQKVIQYAFNELNIQKLLAETQTANVASCNMLEKIGMKLERTIHRFEAEQAIYSINSDYFFAKT